MKSKIQLNIPLWIISTVGIAFSCFVAVFIIYNTPTNAYSTVKIAPPITGQVAEKISLGIPLRIKIQKIKVDAPIKSLGLTRDGEMDTTKGPDDVAWFNLGPRPGQKGSAVIAGHYGVWKNGKVSVFNKLNTLVKGDKISITDDQGKTTSFIVRETRKYARTASAVDVFTSSDGKSHLNLITCIRDPISKSYSKRLVVFTDKI